MLVGNLSSVNSFLLVDAGGLYVRLPWNPKTTAAAPSPDPGAG
jgi:hypothetical protein